MDKLRLGQNGSAARCPQLPLPQRVQRHCGVAVGGLRAALLDVADALKGQADAL